MAVGLASTGAASAHVAGIYTGTATDGSGITPTVGDDGSGTGGLAIISVSYGLNTTCKPGGCTFSTGWGFNLDVEIIGGTASYTCQFGYLYTQAGMTLPADSQSVSGFIGSLTPTFAPYSGGTRPTRSVFCTSPKQAFSASLVAGAARHENAPRPEAPPPARDDPRASGRARLRSERGFGARSSGPRRRRTQGARPPGPRPTACRGSGMSREPRSTAIPAPGARISRCRE